MCSLDYFKRCSSNAGVEADVVEHCSGDNSYEGAESSSEYDCSDVEDEVGKRLSQMVSIPVSPFILCSTHRRHDFANYFLHEVIFA